MKVVGVASFCLAFDNAKFIQQSRNQLHKMAALIALDECYRHTCDLHSNEAMA